MLVRFRVGNFLSFKDVQEFSLIKGKPKNKIERVYETDKSDKLKVLKFAAIFGANASGKSNLVSGMLFARKTILNGLKPSSKHLHYKLESDYGSKPSYFEFEVLIDDICYSYGFEVILKDMKITSEWLIELKPHGNDKAIFERDVEHQLFNSDLKLKGELKTKFSVYSDSIQSDSELLFLAEMNRAKKDLYKERSEISILNELYMWFNKNLSVNFPDEPISNFSYFHDTDNKDEIKRVIKAFGAGITDYIEKPSSLSKIKELIPKEIDMVLDNDIEEMKSPKSENKISSITLRINHDYYFISIKNSEINVSTIAFNHGNNVDFSFSEESDGTRRILDLIEMLFSHNGVYIIDEIDRCLHPQLTYKFIDEYLKAAECKKIQLIVTSHESHLLDFDLLRQDEIWIANKNASGDTALYSLDEYNVRFDKKISKAYLEGRYGGVPIFSSIFPVRED